MKTNTIKTNEKRTYGTNSELKNPKAIASEKLLVKQSIIKKCWGSCEVCGLDEWCGTDNCPLDPQ